MRDFNSADDLPRIPGATIRSLTTGTAGEQRIAALRQAGYDGGNELAAAFERYAASSGSGKPDELPLDEFNQKVAEFFERAGWGRVSTTSLHDLVAAVDVGACWEAQVHGESASPCCHVTTGALAAFFSSFAPFTLAAMEVECAAARGARCRFLLGAPDVLVDVYQRLARGEEYTAALDQLSETSASA